MSECLTTAPGKLMIAGDYAVLFNEPAIVSATDRIARCEFSPRTSMEFGTITNEIVTNNIDHPFFTAALQACSDAGVPIATGKYFLDSSAFFENGHKLGLGSSAASMTALIKMITQLARRDSREEIFSLADRAHRLFSGGLGSGADIAASVYGGIICFQMNCTPIALDNELSSIMSEIIFVNTGRPQNTREYVKRVMAYAQIQRDHIDDFCHSSRRATMNIITCDSDSDRVIIAIEELYEQLQSLGEKAGIDIVSEPHRNIHDIAHRHGGSAKPSGAGGGDFAIALVPRAHRQNCIDELSRYYSPDMNRSYSS